MCRSTIRPTFLVGGSEGPCQHGDAFPGHPSNQHGPHSLHVLLFGFDAGRYVAKNIVAAGLAERCEIQVSYAIGVAEPTSISIETFGTGTIADEKIEALVREHFDLRPFGIMTMLDLLQPIYQQTAAYGHFGRENIGLPWEKTDRAEALKADA